MKSGHRSQRLGPLSRAGSATAVPGFSAVAVVVAVECVVLCRALESDSSMDSRNPGRAVAAVAVTVCSHITNKLLQLYHLC